MAQIQGIVNAPSSNSSPDSSSPIVLMGKQSELLASELHGKFYTANYRGRLFHATVAAVTVPQNASNLTSVFSIFNPANSSVNVELASFDCAVVLATTVVDGIGLYYQRIGGAVTIPSSQTAGTAQGGLLGNGLTPTAQFLTAATHVGTPTLAVIMGTFGAVTDATNGPLHYDFDGKIIVPPNTIVSVAMTTAAGTTNGLTLGMTWLEWPL